MRTAVKGLLVLALIALVAAPLSAADKKKKKKEKKPAELGVVAALQIAKNLDLSEEQKQKIKDIGSTFNDRLAELQKKQAEAIPADVRKARAEAIKAAKESGKKGKELREAIAAAGGASEQVKAALKEIGAERRKLLGELRDAVREVLTEEQKAKLPKAGGGKKKKKADA